MVFRSEATDVVDDCLRGTMVGMDVVGGEEVSAAAFFEEQFLPVAARVGGCGCDEFCLGTAVGEKGYDGRRCFLGIHSGGWRSHALVGEIGFVESEEPFRRVVRIDHFDRVGDISGKGHHGDEVTRGAGRCASAGEC